MEHSVTKPFWSKLDILEALVELDAIWGGTIAASYFLHRDVFALRQRCRSDLKDARLSKDAGAKTYYVYCLTIYWVRQALHYLNYAGVVDFKPKALQ